MKAPKAPALKYIHVDKIRPRQGENPNVMDKTQQAMLVNSIAQLGFIQPVGVRTKLLDGTDYELFDGEHRWLAAKEAGLTKIPALIADHLSDAQAAAAMLSLNRLRGELDLGKVAHVIQDLKQLGFEDLTLTGFNGADIQSLLANVGTSPTNALDELGAGAGAGDGEMESEKSTASKRYSVRLVFDRAEDRDELKAFALKAGATVEAGLLAIVRGEKGASP